MNTLSFFFTTTQALLRTLFLAHDLYQKLYTSQPDFHFKIEEFINAGWPLIYDITICAILWYTMWIGNPTFRRKAIIYGDIVTNIALASTIGPWHGELQLPEYLRVSTATLYLIGDWVQYWRTWEEPMYSNLFSLSELEIDDGPGEPEWFEVDDNDVASEKDADDDLPDPDEFEEKGVD